MFNTLYSKGSYIEDTNVRVINEIKAAESVVKEKTIKGEPLTYKDVKNLNDILVNGYTVIKNYGQFIKFNKDEEKIYVPEKGNNIATKTSRILNVIEVWQDYFKGKYKGMGFFYWILIAALVDIAGFIFFDIAFRRTE